MAKFLRPVLDLDLCYQQSRPNGLNNAWPFVDSCSDYICRKKFQPKPHLEVVVCGCKLFDSYPHDQEYTSDFQNFFLGLHLKIFIYFRPNFQIE